VPASAPSSLAFELDLDAYGGPFDLLLALVLRDGIELVDVPIAEICVAYLERLAADDELDLEAASEFLVLVAALCELKARGLTPSEDEAEEPLDPELAAAELAGRLAEYARVQAGAAWLAGRRAEVGQLLFRSGPPALRPPRPVEATPVASGDPAALRDALAALLEPPPPVSLAHLPRRNLPVRRYLQHLRRLLDERGTFTFEEAAGHLGRAEQAVAFWALLELYRHGEARVVQTEAFGTIRVARTVSATARARRAVADADDAGLDHTTDDAEAVA
jgi:segregation and condensation protein A